MLFHYQDTNHPLASIDSDPSSNYTSNEKYTILEVIAIIINMISISNVSINQVEFGL